MLVCNYLQSGDLLPKFLQFLKSDSELSTFTGIESFDILNTIINFVKLVKPDDIKAKLSMQHKVLMIYVKLKLNMSYACLSIMFIAAQQNNVRKFLQK